MQRPGKRTRSDEPCNICGGVGSANYQQWMVTCTRCCIARIHVYCMHFYFPEVSGEWVCESCCSRDMVRTMPLDSSTRACHDNINALGPPSSVRQTCSDRKMKPVDSGKVKYISLDEVIMLSAAASKNGASTLSNSGPKPGSSSSMKPLWNSLAGSRAAASKSCSSMMKSNRSLGSSDLVKPDRRGGGVRSMVNQKVPQTSKKIKRWRSLIVLCFPLMAMDGSTRACHDNINALGPPSSVRQTCSDRKMKPVDSGKVKYISLDEVIMLSAAASKNGASTLSNSGHKPGSSSSMKPLWNSLAGSRAAASKSCGSMMKSNRSLGSSDLVKPDRHGGGVRSMVNQKVPQTSKKIKR